MEISDKTVIIVHEIMMSTSLRPNVGAIICVNLSKDLCAYLLETIELEPGEDVADIFTALFNSPVACREDWDGLKWSVEFFERSYL